MAKTIIIKKDDYNEYRVPSPDNTEAGAYYTDDKADAIGTATTMYHPKTIKVKFRRVAEHS